MRNFHLPGRSAVFAENGLAATSHPLASATAIEILKNGGNAMDAAIGAAFLLGVCEPHMTGIGGDCFALYSLPGTDEVLGMNGSGRAPAGSDAEHLRSAGHSKMPEDHPASVTIPGAVDAFCKLNAMHGSKPLAEIMAPAIHYAEVGVPVAPRVASDWIGALKNLQGSAKSLYSINGQAPQPGDRFAMPKQKEALERIARDGRAGFYEGPVAEDMITSLRALGGTHTLEDFAQNTPTPTTPVSSSYGPYELMEHPPNGQGIIATLMLNMLKNFDLSKFDPFGSERTHIEIEAAKLAYDARDRYLADGMQNADHLLSQDTADALANMIDPKRALDLSTGLTGSVHKDTVYLCVVDKDRFAVSLIYSVFKSFGSGIASDKYGILLHNRGAGFSLSPDHPNEIAPGKRPMHTIIPAVLRHQGKVIMPFGVMGGQYQANGHARFVTNLVDFDMGPQAAIDGPRSFPEFGKLQLEDGYGVGVKTTLSELGHSIVEPDTAIGGAQAIRIHDNGMLEGASDPRKDGCALGY
ncbi:MAG: gamma-glutamyltransferase family protein [Pseudomonadota bacterium]